MFNWLDREAASGYINCAELPRVVRAGGCLTVDQPWGWGMAGGKGGLH